MFSATVKMAEYEKNVLALSYANHDLYNIYYSLPDIPLKAKLQEQVINPLLIRTFRDYSDFNDYNPNFFQMRHVRQIEEREIPQHLRHLYDLPQRHPVYIPLHLHPFQREVGYILLFYYLYIKRYFTKFYIFYFRFVCTLTNIIVILIVMMMNEMRS